MFLRTFLIAFALFGAAAVAGARTMSKRILIAIAVLAFAGVASAQTRNFGDVFRQPLARAESVGRPRLSTVTLPCVGATYVVSVMEGSCRLSPTGYYDNEGNPQPPNYAGCTSPTGSQASATCQQGCGMRSGTGSCAIVRDHR